MFDLDQILFVIGGNPVSLIEAVSVVTGLICIFLAGRGNKYNFWVGYVYNILLFILFADKHLYSAMLLQPVAFAINFYGHWKWTHPNENEASHTDKTVLKVSTLSWTERGVSLIFLFAASAIWGFILSKLGNIWLKNIFAPDPTPYLDAFSLMLTLIAQFMSALKKWDCWIVWLVVNTINIVLYISAGLVFMPIVSALYLTNGIWSLWTWYRLYKNEKQL